MAAPSARFYLNAPCLALIASLLLSAWPAWSQPQDVAQGRVVLAASAQSVPAAETLAAMLSLELSRAGVFIVVEARRHDRLELNEAEIERLAEKEAQAEPGLIAVVGFGCELELCRVLIEHPRSHSSFEIQVTVNPKVPHQATQALAVTLRDALIGPLLPEMERLARVAATTGPPPPPNITNAALASEAQDDAPPRPNSGISTWPWLLTELSYHGAYMGSSSALLHGPLAGVIILPRDYLGLALTVGWLGIDKAKGSTGSVATHRLSTALATRFIFELGSATMALAPILRLDSVYAQFRPLSAHSSRQTELDLLAGLDLTWTLPLPIEHLGVCLGAGLLGSLVAHSFSINGETIQERPDFSLTWRAGLTYGLPRPR